MNNNSNRIIDILSTLKELPPETIFTLGATGSLFLLFSCVLLQWHLKRCENFWQFISYPKLKGKEWILFAANLFILAYFALTLSYIFHQSIR